jgi:hypothetical protein
MPRVLIHCPKTGAEIPTGREQEIDEFERANLQGEVADCPACGGTHPWNSSDAHLEGEGGAFGSRTL